MKLFTNAINVMKHTFEIFREEEEENHETASSLCERERKKKEVDCKKKGKTSRWTSFVKQFDRLHAHAHTHRTNMQQVYR